MIKIEGIIPAIVTPMHADESINQEELRGQVERQISAGVNGIFCLGTNGEAYILGQEEKETVIRVVVEQVNGRVPVYAGTGCVGTSETVALSRKAQQLGVDALSVISPYFASISQEELYRHYAAVAQSVELPVIIYNMPARTGNNVDYRTVERLASLPNIAGVKDSSGNFDNMLRYIEATDPEHFSVLSGNDSLILWNLLAGGKGGITAVANILPDIMVSIYTHWKRGKLELAKAAQDSIRPIRDCYTLGNPNTITKRATNVMGYAVGPCRSPFHVVSDGAEAALQQTIATHYAQYIAGAPVQ